MKNQNYFRKNCFVLLCFLVSLTISTLFIIKTVRAGYTFWNDGKVAFDVTGQVGDFIGGVIGTILNFISVLLVYRTFAEQIKATEKQNFEDHYFQMLEFHNKNLDEIEFDASGIPAFGKTYTGHSAFELFLTQLTNCLDESRQFIEDYAENKQLYLDRKDGDTMDACLDITYNTVFYGVESVGKNILKNKLKLKYSNDFVEAYVEFISTRPQGYYYGFYATMNHYFRQLFHLIRYVNENARLSYAEKYAYVKALRTNFSDYEQAVLFLNSMSSTGENWERQPVLNESLRGYEECDFQLITKYNLIKNIPLGLIRDIDPEHYYPLVSFEYSKEKKKRPEYQ